MPGRSTLHIKYSLPPNANPSHYDQSESKSLKCKNPSLKL